MNNNLPLVIEIKKNWLRLKHKGKVIKPHLYKVERLHIVNGVINPPSATYDDLVRYGVNSDPYGKILKKNHPVYKDMSLGGPAPKGVWNAFIKIRKNGQKRIELTERIPKKLISQADGRITTSLGTVRTNIQIHTYSPVMGCIRFPEGKDNDYYVFLNYLEKIISEGQRFIVSIMDDFWTNQHLSSY